MIYVILCAPYICTGIVIALANNSSLYGYIQYIPSIYRSYRINYIMYFLCDKYARLLHGVHIGLQLVYLQAPPTLANNLKYSTQTY